MSHNFRLGTIPLLVSFPHNGSLILEDIAQTMTPEGRSSRDTDWFLDRLYDLPELQSASFLIAEFSRYAIDLNRPSTDESLYPGQTTTGLIPKVRFDGSPIYLGKGPDEKETQRRIKEIWTPYHDRIHSEMNRMVDHFGTAVLIEAHSIASVVPKLFDGSLPDFNLGTNRGVSCSTDLEASVASVLNNQNQYSHVVNGRFIGGYITRQFGQPKKNWHALQIELSQATYLDESTLEWDDTKASQVQSVFRNIFQAVTTWIQEQK
jgi:N-formylglutamate deformylase